MNRSLAQLLAAPTAAGMLFLTCVPSIAQGQKSSSQMSPVQQIVNWVLNSLNNESTLDKETFKELLNFIVNFVEPNDDKTLTEIKLLRERIDSQANNDMKSILDGIENLSQEFEKIKARVYSLPKTKDLRQSLEYLEAMLTKLKGNQQEDFQDLEKKIGSIESDIEYIKNILKENQ